MWIQVCNVAMHNNLPIADLVEFAISRDLKYGIIIKNGNATVSDLKVCALLDDFERFQEELSVELLETTNFTFY